MIRAIGNPIYFNLPISRPSIVNLAAGSFSW
jgi:hypothetical protein